MPLGIFPRYVWFRGYPEILAEFICRIWSSNSQDLFFPGFLLMSCSCPKFSYWFFISESSWFFCQSFSHCTYHPLNSILRLKAGKMENFSWGHLFLPSSDCFPESVCFCSLSSVFRKSFCLFCILCLFVLLL